MYRYRGGTDPLDHKGPEWRDELAFQARMIPDLIYGVLFVAGALGALVAFAA
jgi:hypothetical protein